MSPLCIRGKRGSASVCDGLCRAGPDLPLPQSHRSNKGVTALPKSSKQESNHQREGTSPGKPLDLERFAHGCKVSHGQTVVPAASRPLGPQSGTHTSNLLCYICFTASTASMENINSILVKLFFCPKLTEALVLIFKV